MNEIRISSHNLSINTTKWYNLQEDIKLVLIVKIWKMKSIHILVLKSIVIFEGKYLTT